MIMEKGISSVEVLPSKSSQVTAVKVVVKEPETKQTQRGKRVGFVLVHAGAGYHSESKAKEYKHVCKRACQKAIEKLQAGALATDAVTAALIELEENDSGTLDTVGAVVVDQEGNVAAAVSSGGLALKHPGRVGQAALYGCGCWAENTGAHTPYSTAVSTSGCGEHLVRTILARECSCALQTEDAHQALLETMQNKFIGSPFLANEDGVLGGVIVLRSCRCSAEPESSQEKPTLLVEFLWSHTTESMCVGYMSAQDGKAKTHISRLPPGAVAGQSVAIEGGVCRLESPES
ncbi:threonine aspartase 1 isoform X2 [Gymnogyps californianus]|uniref:threonine aspartase 1 isoform X2 n=1 Tax=Gymnogyps californianus TaxID=33616 RepID=UPI0021C63577|nr:threonine aspartase 1 isoform X2 [Gymnogyps californianus]